MDSHRQPRLQRPRLARGCGVVTAALGCVGAIGWGFGFETMYRIRAAWFPMAPSTALAFVALGAAVAARAGRPRRSFARAFSSAAGAAVALFSAAMMVQFFAGVDLGLEGWLAPGSQSFRGVPTGRISPLSALALMASGIAVVLPQGSSRSDRSLLRATGAAVGLLGFVLLAGHSYWTSLFLSVGFIPVAVPTAVGFLVLGAGLLSLAPSGPRASPGGAHRAVPIRRATRPPWVVAVVLVVGILSTIGVSASQLGARSAGVLLVGLASTILLAAYLLSREWYSAALERSQDELRLEGERLTLALEASNGGIWDWDLSTSRVFFSPTWHRSLGYAPEEIAPEPGSWERLVHPDDLAQTRAAFRAHLKGQTLAIEVHNRLLTRSGAYRWNLTRGRVAARAADGRALRILGVDLDLTEYRRLRDELETSRRLESVGYLAAGIAHDFNNLLTVILGNVSLARSDLEPESDAFQFLSVAEGAMEKARELSGRLVTFSGGGAPLRDRVAVSRLLDESSLAPLLPAGVTTEVHVPSGIADVLADESQLSLVVRNLVLNACEAMPDGGRIQMRARELRAEEASRLDLGERSYVEVSLRDAGVGISPERLPHVFDPYFSTKEMGSTKGQGLGLSICYSIVKRHDGAITAESEPGEGATFRVYLPAAS